ncbi:MAG: hypothetical protein IJL58_05160 [Bacteroidales bacterium]|nr:hypothetical protein [Bacteroidales bacterium]
MKFSEILDGLKEGRPYTRSNDAWWGKFIVKQIPQVVPKEVVPKMTSLPDVIKPMISTVGNDPEKIGSISFHDQVLIITCNDYADTSATSYIPTWEDLFAEDWIYA